MIYDRQVVEAGRGLQGGRRLCFATLPSTQTYALTHAASLQHGDVVWARDQTQGRGRFDRVWQAASGRSLTFSILLKQAAGTTMAPVTLQLAALAVCTALRERNVDAGLKWPNDIVTPRGKIAGLLAEGIPDADAMALGIGINVTMTREDFTGLPATKPATSIRLETGRTASVRQVLDEVLTALDQGLTRVTAEGAGFLSAAWARYDSLLGQHLTVHAADGQTHEGRYRGMDSNGALQLKDDTGKIQVFWSGDVSLRARAMPPID